MAKRFSGYNPCEDKDWLYQKFVVEGKSREQIAEEIGCAASTVHVWLWKHRITTPKSFTVDQLRDLHVRQRKSVTEIAEIIGVSYDTIIYQLRVNGIPYTPNIGRNDRLAKYTREWLTDN
jgi:transposase